jgi:hypothetical protein
VWGKEGGTSWEACESGAANCGVPIQLTIAMKRTLCVGDISVDVRMEVFSRAVAAGLTGAVARASLVAAAVRSASRAALVAKPKFRSRVLCGRCGW